MNRLVLMKWHSLLAAFTLPVAVMFMVTGSLYTWGLKGSYENKVIDVSLTKPMASDVDTLTKLAVSQLEALDLAAPEGTPKLKTYGDHFLLEWTGSSKDLILEPTNDVLVAKLTIKHTTWYRSLVQLHKAKGGTVFKVYAVIFSVILGALLLSGFMMAWQTPKLRSATAKSALLGVVSFLLVVWLS